MTERLEEAYRRMALLEGMPRSLTSKLLLLRQSIWPAAFYGAEGHLLSVQEVARLRSAASRTLLGRKGLPGPQCLASGPS